MLLYNHINDIEYHSHKKINILKSNGLSKNRHIYQIVNKIQL